MDFSIYGQLDIYGGGQEGRLTQEFRGLASMRSAAFSQISMPSTSIVLNGALRDVPDFTKIKHMSYPSNGSRLFTNCTPSWRIGTSPCECTELDINDRILLGVSTATLSTFVDDTGFDTWPGIEGQRLGVQPGIKNNYI